MGRWLTVKILEKGRGEEGMMSAIVLRQGVYVAALLFQIPSWVKKNFYYKPTWFTTRKKIIYIYINCWLGYTNFIFNFNVIINLGNFLRGRGILASPRLNPATRCALSDYPETPGYGGARNSSSSRNRSEIYIYIRTYFFFFHFF